MVLPREAPCNSRSAIPASPADQIVNGEISSSAHSTGPTCTLKETNAPRLVLHRTSGRRSRLTSGPSLHRCSRSVASERSCGASAPMAAVRIVRMGGDLPQRTLPLQIAITAAEASKRISTGAPATRASFLTWRSRRVCSTTSFLTPSERSRVMARSFTERIVHESAAKRIELPK